MEQQQPEEIDLEQMLADVQRDRLRFRNGNNTLPAAVSQEIDRTVLSYIEDLLKVILSHDESIGDLEESVDGGYSAGPPLSEQLVAHIIELAGMAEGLAIERAQLSEMIHGCSTLQEVKSKVGKVGDIQASLKHVVDLSKLVIAEMASLGGVDEPPEGEPTDDVAVAES